MDTRNGNLTLRYSQSCSIGSSGCIASNSKTEITAMKLRWACSSSSRRCSNSLKSSWLTSLTPHLPRYPRNDNRKHLNSPPPSSFCLYRRGLQRSDLIAEFTAKGKYEFHFHGGGDVVECFDSGITNASF